MLPDSLSRYDDEVVSISSSNETVDDLPGPGRTLGNLYNHLGRKLETLIDRIAACRGAGPVNVGRRIETMVSYSTVELTSDERVRVRRELKRLIAYSKYDYSFEFDSSLFLF